MMCCVVTGGTGNIGNALVKLLLQQGYVVYVLCNPLSKRIQFLPQAENCRIIKCDLSDLSGVSRLIKYPCSMFFHLAWHASYGQERNNPYVQVNNITAALDAVKLAQNTGCDIFVGAGSQAQYGPCHGPLTEETPLKPTTHYGSAKCCAEQMSRILCNELQIKHIWARILSVYGPCDGPYTLVSYLIECFLKGKEAVLTPCEQLWDFLFAEDAARALLALAEKGHANNAYCVASGQNRPLREFIHAWHAVTQRKARLHIGGRAYPDGHVQSLTANISKLHQDTGFTPCVSFEEGMQRTLAWYRSNHNMCGVVQ